jgi:AAA domain
MLYTRRWRSPPWTASRWLCIDHELVCHKGPPLHVAKPSSSTDRISATLPAKADGFQHLSMLQGMEKAVVILSTAVTRAGSFVSDARRLNVALTRAKRHMIIVGEYKTPA